MSAEIFLSAYVPSPPTVAANPTRIKATIENIQKAIKDSAENPNSSENQFEMRTNSLD
jgi:hypothetical protein